jgi:26S proteasome regulatory subunit N10
MDPELAMALRISMEEERVRQERLAAQEAAATQPADVNTDTSNAMDSDVNMMMEDANLGLSEEEALLQQALAMSMNETNDSFPLADGMEDTILHGGTDSEIMELDEEDKIAMQAALQMSMQAALAGTDADAANETATFQDPEFVSELLGATPGVDPNDPEIQEALRKAAEEKKPSNDEDKE